MAYAMHTIPLNRPASSHLTRIYGYSQSDLLGSVNCDTAIALMAAHAILHTDGRIWDKFTADEDVLEIMSSGIVWHSRWLAADDNRTPGEDYAHGAQVADIDEICELEGCPVTFTEVGYTGTLDSNEFGLPLKEAMANVFKAHERGITHTFILTIKDQSTCVAINNGIFFIFDSHPHDKRGLPDEENGKAVMVTCDSHKLLMQYLWRKYEASEYPDTLYTLVNVVATDLPQGSRNRSSYDEVYGKLFTNIVPTKESLQGAATTFSSYSVSAAAKLTAAAQATQVKMNDLHVIERMDTLFDQVEERLDQYIDTKGGSAPPKTSKAKATILAESDMDSTPLNTDTGINTNASPPSSSDSVAPANSAPSDTTSDTQEALPVEDDGPLMDKEGKTHVPF